MKLLVAAIGVVVAGGGVARADTANFAFRFPWDMTSLPGGSAYGVVGLGIDAGARVSPHWYAGAVIDLEMEIHSGTATTANPAGVNLLDRQRLGGELRYYTGDAPQPDQVLGGQRWIGLRFGAETVDDRTTVGRFVDVTLAHDSIFGGGLSMGWYASLGLSFETGAAWDGTTAMATARVPAVSAPSSGAIEAAPYLTFGMRLGFH